jgi:hypothetical protein
MLLSDLAKINYLIRVRCSIHMSTTYFLAADLIDVYGDQPVYEMIMPCARCGSAEFVTIKDHSPSGGDYGHLKVRRPGPVRTTQTWQTVVLGDEA